MDKKGLLYALGAYFFWGLFPLYWKFLQHVPAPQLIGHRVVWSFALLLLFLLVSRQFTDFRRYLLDRKTLLVYAVAAVLIGVNWLVYVWAVNAEFIVETSLGYFINPLLSVVLGMLFFRERLRSWQWLAVILAAIGVIFLAVSYGRLPWIALTLAFSFGFYGLVKKLAPLGSLYGLTFETGTLLLPAGLYLVFCEVTHTGAFTHTGLLADLLMVGAGLVTTVPLLMFASAARRIPLSSIGLMQYIAPTLQFLIGVFVYKEPFLPQQLFGFGIVWLSLLIFAAESVYHNRRMPITKDPIQM
jgi:chloramphenicol-sensitive protein RarD